MKWISGEKEALEFVAARVDAALGYPRCERLAGTCEPTPDTCPCDNSRAPVDTCPFRTTSEALVLDAADGCRYPLTQRAEGVCEKDHKLRELLRATVVTLVLL